MSGVFEWSPLDTANYWTYSSTKSEDVKQLEAAFVTHLYKP